MSQLLTKLISLFICFSLIFEQSVFAQSLDLSAHFANFGRSIAQSDKFRPLHLRYLGYDNLNQGFKLLLDKGDTRKEDLENKAYIEENTQTLLKYFFTGLALPNDKFWVNLRPDSPENILDHDLEKTDIGRIFLEADLQLKKDTAQWTSPQTPEGKLYWEKLYQRAGELFGSENITIPTLTRPWIVPNEIIIRESTNDAYIYKATLKVMLEEDYIKSQVTGYKSQVNFEQYAFKDSRMKELNVYSTQLIRETIIPKLTYEVNTSKRYAPLRQVYYSLILARWFKVRFRSPQSTDHRPQNNPYIKLIDSGNLTSNFQPLTTQHPYSKEYYFKQYQRSFQDGEYNLSEPTYTPFGQSIRRYMSGGLEMKLPVMPKVGERTEDIISIPTVSASPLRISNIFSWLGDFVVRKEKSQLEKGEVIEITYKTLIKIILFEGRKGETRLEISNYSDLPEKKFKFLSKDIGYAIIQRGVSREDLRLQTQLLGITKEVKEREEGVRPGGIKALRDKEVVIIGGGFNPAIENMMSSIGIFELPRGSSEELIRIERDGHKFIITNLNPESIKIITGKDSESRKLEKEPRPEGLILLEKILRNLPFYVRKSVSLLRGERDEDIGTISDRFSPDDKIIKLEKSRGGYKIIGRDEKIFLEESVSDSVRKVLKEIEGLSYKIVFLESSPPNTPSFFRPFEINVIEKTPPMSGNPSFTSSPASVGGIDFTHLPIVTQAITNLGSSPLRSSSYLPLRQLNLKQEYQAIERLASSGITPSPERLKSYLQASCLQERIGEEKDKAVGVLAEVLREEETSLRPTDPGLMDILVVIESAASNQQLKEIFLGKN